VVAWVSAGLIVLSSSALTWAQGFSADLISRIPKQTLPPAKLFAANGDIRIDVPSGQSETGLSYAAFTIWYVKSTSQVRLSPRPKKWTSFDAQREVVFFAELNNLTFQPSGLSDLCGQYISHIKNLSNADRRPDLMEILSHTSCQDIGSEETQGRKSEKLRVVYPQTSGFTLWLDSEIRFVTKFEASESGASTELQNLKVEDQPASLFALPKGARTLF
jgi:hypothetical protein